MGRRRDLTIYGYGNRALVVVAKVVLGPTVGGWLALAPFQLTQMTFDRELAIFRFALGDRRHGDDGKNKRRSATAKNLYVMGTSEA